MTKIIRRSPVQIEEFANAEDLLDALGRRDPRWAPRPREWVFRGQADASWSLVPTALRTDLDFPLGPDDKPKQHDTHRSRIVFEAGLIRAFLLQVDRQGLPIPGDEQHNWRDLESLLRRLTQLRRGEPFPPTDVAPVFALAQHHGVPTRLLDWSERPLVASYFAAIGAVQRLELGHQKPDEHLAIWALSGTAGAFLEGSPIRIAYVRPARAANPNLRAQEGVFTVLIDRERGAEDGPDFPPLDVLLTDAGDGLERDGACMSPCLRRLDMPVSQAGRLLRLLEAEFVTGTNLFPGFDGAVRALRERRYFDVATALQ